MYLSEPPPPPVAINSSNIPCQNKYSSTQVGEKDLHVLKEVVSSILTKVGFVFFVSSVAESVRT